MKAKLSELLRLLGVRQPAEQRRAHVGQGEEIRLFLPLTEDRKLLVGRLTQDGDDFVFEYSDEFAKGTFPLLPDFPRREVRQYRSHVLWPFFLVRLPPVDRPDVQQEIRERNLEPDDKLQLLGSLGRRAISSPYELELAHHVT